MNVDLNCDLGENIGNDEKIMPYITSANIACGFHAGGPSVMRATVRLAKNHAVAVGAHPGWPDIHGFGRTEMSLPLEDVEALVLYQIGALHAIAKAEGVELLHVKPHGALYNQAAKDKELAFAIARAVRRFSSSLYLVGLAGSRLIEAGIETGLCVLNEGFPDRKYNSDGTLMSRKIPGSVLTSPEEVAANAVKLAKGGILFGEQRVSIDTLCLHGDNVHAVQNARSVHDALVRSGIPISSF